MSEKPQMPVEIPAEAPHNRAIPSQYVPIPLAQDFEPETPAVPLSHYLWILRRHLWKIVAFVAACMLVTFVVSARLKPIYESTATVDVDLQAPSAVVGQGSTGSCNHRRPGCILRHTDQAHSIGRRAAPGGRAVSSVEAAKGRIRARTWEGAGGLLGTPVSWQAFT